MSDPCVLASSRWLSLRGAWVWAVALGVFAIAVKAGVCRPLDHAAAQAVGALHTPGVEAVARTLSFFGSSPWIVSVVGVMCGWWYRCGQRTQVVDFLGAGLFGLLIQCALRLWVAQWRPDALFTMTDPSDTLPLFYPRYELAGFTSGHAFRSAWLYGWWAAALRRRAAWWAVLGMIGCGILILIVGWTRLYLNRHWLTDVVGGWLVAALAISAVTALRDRACRRS